MRHHVDMYPVISSAPPGRIISVSIRKWNEILTAPGLLSPTLCGGLRAAIVLFFPPDNWPTSWVSFST
jgi:hypothetical protein